MQRTQKTKKERKKKKTQRTGKGTKRKKKKKKYRVKIDAVFLNVFNILKHKINSTSNYFEVIQVRVAVIKKADESRERGGVGEGKCMHCR